MNRSALLVIDATINLVLGFLLVIFPKPIVEALGVPHTDTAFYPSIFGAVLFGIGITLVIEWRRKPSGLTGLGLGGAIAINLCSASQPCETSCPTLQTSGQTTILTPP